MLYKTGERAATAKKQKQIIERIFANISKDRFDIDLNFDDIETNALKDFWLYTSGMMGVQNFENSSKDISPETARQILNGKFYVKRLNAEDIEKIKKQYGISNTKYESKKTIILNAIQDGLFKIEKTIDPVNRQVHTDLVLETGSIKYSVVGKEFVKFDNYDDLNDNEVMEHYRNLRNVIVHSAPIATFNNSQVAFLGRKYDKEHAMVGVETMLMSKMWLRGFSEMFADTHTKLRAADFENLLNWNYFMHDNMFDERGVERAMINLKSLLPPSLAQNMTKEMTYLVKDNVACYDNFYVKSEGEKAKIISNLLVNHVALNMKYPKSINLPIIYKIQQLVAQIVNEKESADATKQNAEQTMNDSFKQAAIIVERIEQKKAQLEKALKFNNLDKQSKAIVFAEIAKLNKQMEIFANAQQQIKLMNKSETLNMNLFDPEGLKYLPVEVAFNVMCLAAYNALVTSGFYEDVLHNLAFKNMSEEFSEIIKQIKPENLFFVQKPVYSMQKAMQSVSNTAYLLESMRNALVHGKVSYKLPGEMYDKNLSFEDVWVTFKASHGNVLICGKMKDFFKLFVSDGFFVSRDKLTPEVAAKNKIKKVKNKTNTNSDDVNQMTDD